VPRRKVVARREIEGDPRYGSVLVAKFINSLMRRGKKSTAEKIFYGSMDIIEKKAGQDGLGVFKQAVSNTKPLLEVRSRRVGGATYQVPVEVRQERRTTLAIRWLIGFAKARQGKSMQEKLAAELMAAAKGEGGAIKKREDMHRMAEANKAFAHYRW